MKKILSLFAALTIVAVSYAQPPNVPAEKGAQFGAATTADNAREIAAVLPTVMASEGKKVDVKIIGEVVEVCQQMGCWLRIKHGDETVTVKMKGHKWFVPTALVGKRIVIDGTAEYKITSVDDLKHLAEDAGKSKEEVDAIKEPKKEVTVEAKGILVI